MRNLAVIWIYSLLEGVLSSSGTPSESQTLQVRDFNNRSALNYTWHSQVVGDQALVVGELTWQQFSGADWRDNYEIRTCMEWGDDGSFQTSRANRVIFYGGVRGRAFTDVRNVNAAYRNWELSSAVQWCARKSDSIVFEQANPANSSLIDITASSINPTNRTATVSFTRPFIAVPGQNMDLIADSTYDIYLSWGIWGGSFDENNLNTRGPIAQSPVQSLRLPLVSKFQVLQAPGAELLNDGTGIASIVKVGQKLGAQYIFANVLCLSTMLAAVLFQ